MAFNHQFWAPLLGEDFPKQAIALANTLEARLMPTFQNIDQEATEIQERTYRELCSRPYDDRFDDSDLHQMAHDAGLEHYQLMAGIQQGLINSFSASLYHLYEQQIFFFLRREVLHVREQHDINLLKLSVFRERIQHTGIDVSAFPSAAKIHELSQLANTIKHGQGASSQKLFALRPDLFTHPSIAQLGLSVSSNPHIFIPIMGEDVFVTLGDIRIYAAAIGDFWHSLLDALAKH